MILRNLWGFKPKNPRRRNKMKIHPWVLKIHGWKFTWGEIKNSRLKIHGLKIHMGLYGWACVGLFCGSVFPVVVLCSVVVFRGRVPCFNACKGKHNKRPPQQEKRLQDIFFCPIVIWKQNEKSKRNLPIYIRCEKFLQKYQKKFAKLFFCCTFVPEPKNNIPC
jgi:hypothetical protein